VCSPVFLSKRVCCWSLLSCPDLRVPLVDDLLAVLDLCEDLLVDDLLLSKICVRIFL
jgi:hypothetical protein